MRGDRAVELAVELTLAWLPRSSEPITFEALVDHIVRLADRLQSLALELEPESPEIRERRRWIKQRAQQQLSSDSQPADQGPSEG